VVQSSEWSKELLLAALETGDQPVCYDVREGRWFGAAELRCAIDRCAALLAAPRKALAFCFCDNTVEFLTAYLACWTAGHAALLLDARLDAGFRARLCSLYNPEFLLAPTSVAGQTGFGAAEQYTLRSSDGPIVWRRQFDPAATPIHSDLAVLLSTSGTTGSPKAVRLSYRNVVSNALQIRDALSIDARQRAITTLPLHYSYGLSVVNSHLAAGASLVLTGEGVLSNAFWTAFRETGCTSLAAIPYMYQMLQRLDLNALSVPTLTTMTQAGGKLHDTLIARFHALMSQRRGRFFFMYGQTEATARIAVLPPEALPSKLGSAGKAVAGGSLAIYQDGKPASGALAEGEVVYSGPNVMLGYASSRQDLAEGPSLDGTLATGDLGYLDDDGYLYITGRNKRFAKILGLRINLDEVESLLKIHGPTAVLDSGAERLAIYCEHDDGQDFATYAETLGHKLKLHPSVFAFRRVACMPLNSNGKPDYQRLASQ
jgi:acyl-CoA synthetase (AMP-forming)/AMP-acid ligase II